MANQKNNNSNKDQYLKDFVQEQQKLNDITIDLPDYKNQITEVKQYILDNMQIAFAKHLTQFRKAFAIGNKFAKNITNET